MCPGAKSPTMLWLNGAEPKGEILRKVKSSMNGWYAYKGLVFTLNDGAQFHLEISNIILRITVSTFNTLMVQLISSDEFQSI